jgi:hypothetical protein
VHAEPAEWNRGSSLACGAKRNQPHEVWQAEIPATCRMIPAQAAELQKHRRQAGKP